MTGIRRFSPPLMAVLLAALLIWLVVGRDKADAVIPQQIAPIELSPAEANLDNRQKIFGGFEAPDYGKKLETASERPLFSENRRHPVPEAPEPQPEIVEATPTEAEPEPPVQAPVVEAPPPAMTFHGYLKTGEDLRALLQISDSGETRWVSEGDKIQDWKITEISPSSVRLEKDGNDHILKQDQ